MGICSKVSFFGGLAGWFFLAYALAKEFPTLNPSKLNKIMAEERYKVSRAIEDCNSNITNKAELVRRMGYTGELYSGEIIFTNARANYDSAILGIGPRMVHKHLGFHVSSGFLSEKDLKELLEGRVDTNRNYFSKTR